MRHRLIAAGAASSVLLIGTAVPATASTAPTGFCETEFGLQTLLPFGGLGEQEGDVARSNANDIAIGTVSEDAKSLDVELINEDYEIKLVVVGGEAAFVTYEEPPFTGLTFGDPPDLIYSWWVCGEKIKEAPKSSPTETKPTTKPTHTGSPKAVPTNIPAGSGTSNSDAPWALFGVAAAGATAAAAAGTVIGRRRNPNRV
jgi:hypothetical protein